MNFKVIEKRPLLSILLISLILRGVYLLLHFPLWWDTHVYLGMAKYIFSLGQMGVWESYRPLLFPILMGAVWKMGLPLVAAGTMMDVVLSLSVVYLTYKIGSLFSQKVAVISSLITAITPLFLKFTGLILVEPLAMVLSLLGVYVFLNGKNFWAGVLLSLSFLTKFPQGIFFAAAGTAVLFRRERWKEKIISELWLVLGFILPALPYFIFNYYRYPTMWEPFISGSWIVSTATWLYSSGASYYFWAVFAAFPVLLFFFSYLYDFFRLKLWKEESHLLMMLICSLTIAYFMYVPRKEDRYLVMILPLLSILSAYSIALIYDLLKKKSEPAIKAKSFLILVMVLMIIPLPVALFLEKPTITAYDEAISIIKEREITGTILSSDPFFISYVDNTLKLLSGTDYASIMYEENKGKYELLFLNDCDIPCAPEDTVCAEKMQELMTSIGQENRQLFNETVYFTWNKRYCHYYLYVPT